MMATFQGEMDTTIITITILQAVKMFTGSWGPDYDYKYRLITVF